MGDGDQSRGLAAARRHVREALETLDFFVVSENVAATIP